MSNAYGEQFPRIGGLFLAGTQYMRSTVYEAVVKAGYDDLNPAQVNIFRYPTLDQMSPTDIAGDLLITKQSVHYILDHLQDRGYLVREAHPSNKRRRVVQLTPRGRQLEREVQKQARLAEGSLSEVLGEAKFTQLLRLLDTLSPTFAARGARADLLSTTP